MNRVRRSLTALVVGAAGAALALGAVTTFTPKTASIVHADPSPAAATERALSTAQDLSAAFEHIATTIQPSVVSIRSARRVRANPHGDSPLPDLGGEFFERFFGPGGGGRDYEARGLGSGVIVAANGTILTNNHVVDNADEVTVILTDDSEYTAKVIGTDPKTDLAVLRIEAANLKPAKLGDSDALRIGEWVVAVGNPFGLSSSISAGIVSAKGRNDVRIADYEDFIQTDAAINPGNSGGPLVNLQGEVVGINTAIFTRTGGYMGIGFAIPANMAKSIMTSLIAEGRVVRGWLGVQIQNVNADLAASFDYNGKAGVLVSDVVSGSPAARGGMKTEDIIVRFAGKKVANVTELRSIVASTRPGTTADVEVWRDGSSKTLRIDVDEQETAASERPQTEPEVSDLGIGVRTMTPELARRAGLDDEVAGVLVTSVEPLSTASRAGLARGDVILSVQGHEVSSVREFESAVDRADLEQGVRLHVRRGDGRQVLVLRQPKGDQDG